MASHIRFYHLAAELSRWPSIVPVVLLSGALLIGIATPTEAQFTNVADGVTGNTGHTYGVAWVDIDNDGLLDLYMTNSGTLSFNTNMLLRNLGGGSFSQFPAIGLVSTEAGRGMTWGDFDNDGDADVYYSNVGVTNRLVRNEGGLGTVDITGFPVDNTNPGYGVSWVDADNNGVLDLYLCNSGANNELFKGFGNGSFNPDGNALLRDPQTANSAAWGDYDGDGDQDLYLCRRDGIPNLLIQNNSPNWTDVTIGPLGDTDRTNGADWGDYDNDGDLDLYLSNENAANKLLRNDPGGFTDMTSGTPLGDTGDGQCAAWADYDNDRDLDLYLVNDGQPNKLFRNDGFGLWADVTSGDLADSSLSRGMTWGDYDNDGDLDIYVASEDANLLLRNESNNGFHWVHLKLVGSASNRSAIGARVILDTEFFSQTREVSGSNGYLSQGSLLVEFGLRDDPDVDQIEIRWPSGHVQVISDPPIDQLIEVVEPGFLNETRGPLTGDRNNQGVAWADIDQDGYQDLYVTGYAGTSSRFYLNDGAGEFSDETVPQLLGPSNATSATWVDWDNDGDRDLYIGSDGSSNQRVINNGGGFGTSSSGVMGNSGSTRATPWADYDQDGNVDCYIVNDGSSNKLARNNPAGIFSDVTAFPMNENDGSGGAWGDYDGDGDQDFYLANESGANQLFRNDAGVFVDATSGPLGDVSSTQGVAWGDYDRDLDLDLFLCNLGTADRLFRNDEGGGFVDVTSGDLGDTGDSRGCAWADYDNDGDLDLYVTGTNRNHGLLRNDGGDIFITDKRVAAMGLSTPDREFTGVAWADYDNDGDLDVFVSNQAGENRLLMNRLDNGKNWAQFDLEGGATNRSAVGTRMLLYAWPVSWMGEVSAGSGFGSQDSPTLEFGLGSRAVIDSVIIYWPSGNVQYLTNLAVNQKHHVVEPILFTDVTTPELSAPANSRGVSWGDFDDDGDPDLYVANTGSANKLYRNEGGGVLIDHSPAPLGDTGNGQSGPWADYNNDGNLDLFLVNYDSANKMFRNEGGGAFADASAAIGGALATQIHGAWVDYDQDGNLDLFITGLSEHKLMQNQGSDVFADVSFPELELSSSGRGCSWGDYDGDGDLDVYLCNATGANRMIRNENGTDFVDATTGPLAGDSGDVAADWGDYDNDGDLDLFIGNGAATRPNKLLRNEGGGSFIDVTSPAVRESTVVLSAMWGDIDNDGDLDVYVGNAGQQNRLYRNEGGGDFAKILFGALLIEDETRGSALADYDGDGDLDIFESTGSAIGGSGVNRLLRNDEDTGHHWLHIDLVGTISNRSAIGARVELTEAGSIQAREVTAGSGYISQGDLRVEFGLGPNPSVVDTVRVRWPSGIVQSLLGVPVDQVIEIVEEDVTVAVEETPKPMVLSLTSPYPNPFRSDVMIRYALPTRDRVQLAIFDVRGRRVALLANGLQNAGRHAVKWNGDSEGGRALGSGLYWVRLQSGYEVRTRKVLLMRR